MPTGVRTPVVSMSMRALIGMVQALDTPGIASAAFISSTSCSLETCSGVMCPKIALSQRGAQVHPEYQVSTLRH